MPIERLFDVDPAPPQELYDSVRFPPSPPARPHVYMNTVTTVDGKTLIGPRGSTARGLGSQTDQILMRRLEQAADGIIVGAGTLRAGPVIYPPEKWRIAVSRSGSVDTTNRFFTDAPGRAIILVTEATPQEERDRLARSAAVRVVGRDAVDVAAALVLLRSELGIERLLLEGGADLNAAFIEARVVDEVFLTVAPKVKGGADLPTMVDGAGLPGYEVLALELQSIYREDSELYLRYRARPDRETRS